MTTKVADSVATQYAARTSNNASTLTKLQSKTMVKSLKYKNPLNRGQKKKPEPSPPPSDAILSQNNADIKLADVDTLDFNSFVVDLNDDLSAVKVDASKFDDLNAFGSYGIDFADADLDDIKDMKSVFDSQKFDLDKIKKVSPQPPAAEEVPLMGSPPNMAPKPNGAPLAPKAPSGAPIAPKAPTGAPMAPKAPKAHAGAPMAPKAPIAPSAAAAGAPMAPIAPMPTARVSKAKKQFAAAATPISESPQINDNIRPEEYDKAADIRHNPDGSIMDKTNQTQQLQQAAKVSQFSGLQSNRNVRDTKKEDEDLSKHTKGKVTHFTGLDQSVRKIITADEEEQKRTADMRLVHKQKSLFSKKGMQKRQSMKRTSIVVDDSVKDAAHAAKNVFKAMEKQNTKKKIGKNSKKPTAKRAKSRVKSKVSIIPEEK